MANSFSIIVNDKSGFSSNDIIAKIKKDSSNPKESLQGIIEILNGMLAGFSHEGTIDVDVNTNALVSASATITLASVQAGDTVTIAGVTLTAHAATQSGTVFKVGVSDTADAADLVRCILANTSLDDWVTASSLVDVVTVTCLVPGVVGNGLTLVSSNGTRLAVTGSGRLAGGAGGSSSSAVGKTQYNFGG